MLRTTAALCAAGLCAASAVVAACGSGGGGDGAHPADQEGVSAVAVADRQGATADPTVAGHAVTTFGAELFAAMRAGDDADANLTISPTSIAVALAMLEPGATGPAADQLHQLLAIDDPAAYHASMNALEQDLEARKPDPVQDVGDQKQDPGEVTIRLANAAYLQQGYPFEPAYLETIGASYGPVLNEVDFGPDPDAVAHAINAFVSGATNERIPQLIADGAIDPATVLALVNALYLKASWLEPFQASATADRPFTRADGTTVTAAMMDGASDSSAEGDGWRGAEKVYVGGLAMQLILPDEGRFDDVAANMGEVITELDANRTGGAQLVVPRFEVRANRELDPALRSLGLVAPYENGNLLGIADDPDLVLSKVIHETWVAVDEEGTEAAAATVVLMVALSGVAEPPQPLILDRPFLYRIYDTRSGATLFLGQVTDPTAG